VDHRGLSHRLHLGQLLWGPIGAVMAIAPLLGPILAGQILALAGWRAIFWTLVGVGLATLAALTNPLLGADFLQCGLQLGRHRSCIAGDRWLDEPKEMLFQNLTALTG
jgi:MFS family permease